MCEASKLEVSKNDVDEEKWENTCHHEMNLEGEIEEKQNSILPSLETGLYSVALFEKKGCSEYHLYLLFQCKYIFKINYKAPIVLMGRCSILLQWWQNVD